jgi:hypothetical protein
LPSISKEIPVKRFLIALALVIPSVASSSQAIPFDQRGPMVSLTTSAVYLGQYEPFNHSRTLFGWSAVPDVSVTRRLGIQAEVSNLYMRSVSPGENRFILAAGPRYRFPYSTRFKIMPFLFGEGGKIRTSEPFNPHILWDPMFKAGFGFEYHVSRRLSLNLVPGEVLGEHLPDGTWDDSYGARAGVTFHLLP